MAEEESRGGIECLVEPEATLDDTFEMFRIIGRGSFGRVKLVKHRPTERVMAMKCMWKQHLVDHHQVNNVIQEKNAMADMSWHPFIIKLFGVYEDKDQLYFFLECLQGGELWSLLYQNQEALPRTNRYGLQEDVARLYAANVLEGFNCIHGCGYIYRDLKPENLLVANDGYLKIIDFGFAKKLKGGQKTQTLCSTPEYLSPEMILSQGHNRCTDYWAFGVLVYELLYGETPFCDDDQTKIFQNIVHADRVIGPALKRAGLPADARDLIWRLLSKNPRLRLGMLSGGINDIMDHKWFNGLVDWEALREKQYMTPWEPPVSDEMDCANFDEYDEDPEALVFVGAPDLFAGFMDGTEDGSPGEGQEAA